MANISFRIDNDIKQRLRRVAKLTGTRQSAISREAIYDRMEELKDILVARARLAKPFQPISNEEVWKDIGIDN